MDAEVVHGFDLLNYKLIYRLKPLFQSSQKLVTGNFGLLLPQYVVKAVSACSPEFPRIEIQIDVHDVEKREIRKGIHTNNMKINFG